MEETDTNKEYVDIGDCDDTSSVIMTDDTEIDMILNTIDYLEDTQEKYAKIVHNMWDKLNVFRGSGDCTILQKLTYRDRQKFFDMMYSQKHPKLLSIALTRLVKRIDVLNKKL